LDHNLCGLEDAPAIASVVEVFKGDISTFLTDDESNEIILFYTTDKEVRGERQFPVPIRRDDEGFLAFPSLYGACLDSTDEVPTELTLSSSVMNIQECNFFNLGWSDLRDDELEFLRSGDFSGYEPSDLTALLMNNADDEDINTESNDSGSDYGDVQTSNSDVPTSMDAEVNDREDHDAYVSMETDETSFSSSRTSPILQYISSLFFVLIGCSSMLVWMW